MPEDKKDKYEYVLDSDLRWRLEKSDMGQETPKKQTDVPPVTPEQ